MNQKDYLELLCAPWDPPEDISLPTSPIIAKISVTSCRAVLKKNSSVRIKSLLPKPESIVIRPESMSDYHTLSVFIKSSIKSLGINQNVIYFSDVDEEHKYMFDIECFYAAMRGKKEISMVAVTLHSDLVKRMLTWERMSQAVQNDLVPPPEITARKQSIESMQAVSSVERRHKVIEIMNDEDSMDFSGPVYRKNPDDPVCTLTVWKRYATLLLALNSLLFTIDNQFNQIGRTTQVDENIVSEICRKILEDHTVQNDSE